MNYQEAAAFLHNLQFFKIKLRLDSMQHFLDSVGCPHKRIKFVHVAGTNGKGSVSATLCGLLAGSGYKVGLYTSPHLNSVRERFRINDRFISRNDFAELASQIKNALQDREITYFEFTTTLALLWFARQQVDLAILEVGMGGRLDATNVITPLVSVITNVAMDHQAWLGDTLTKISQEKAGIIKAKVPVISGVNADESRTVVTETCKKNKSPLYLLADHFNITKEADGSLTYRGIDGKITDSLHSNLKGRHQVGNTGLALATLELLADVNFKVDFSLINNSLQAIKWPGRLEYFSLSQKDKTYKYLLDGAHNPAGVHTLKQTLTTEFDFEKLIMIWGSMIDKEITESLSIITPICDYIIFTAVAGERSATAEQLQHALPSASPARLSDDTSNLPLHKPRKVYCTDSVADALHKAVNLAKKRDLICIAGSLYLIGEVRKLLLGEIINEFNTYPIMKKEK